jgi:hypothetical protein
MREPEVADRYRGRFSSAAGRLDQLSAVDAAVRRRVDEESRDTWLVVSGVPDVPGRLPISVGVKDETQRWIQAAINDSPGHPMLYRLGSDISTGFRRYISGHLTDDEGHAGRAVAELHSDGAAGLAMVVGWPWNDGSTELPRPANTIADTGLAIAVLDLLHIVGSHAKRAGAAGGISVIAALHSHEPFVLGHTRFHGFPERVHGTRMLAELEMTSHSFAIDDPVDPTRLVAAGSLVASDLTSGFGLAQCLQLDVDGAVRRKYVESDFARLLNWADRKGVRISDDTVSFW